MQIMRAVRLIYRIKIRSKPASDLLDLPNLSEPHLCGSAGCFYCVYTGLSASLWGAAVSSFSGAFSSDFPEFPPPANFRKYA